MIHYSCDRCKRRIDPAQEVRYAVKIEVQAVAEPAEDAQPDEDRDHLAEINEMLDDLDLDDLDLCGDDERRKLSFDLCAQCYRKYVQDPLGADTLVHLGFSHN